MLKEHIMKRVYDSCGRIRFKRNPRLTLLRNNNEADGVQLCLPMKQLSDELNLNSLNSVINMKPDNVIKRVKESSTDSNHVLIFTVDKSVFIKHTLSSSSVKIPEVPERTKPILVEFSSPNIAKPFHMGHFRSTIIGNFISNTMSMNHNVKKINYLGDWGTQIGYVKAGLKNMNVSKIALEENPMKELYKAYVNAYNAPNMLEKAREIFFKLEQGDLEENSEWEMIRNATIKNLTETYAILGVMFDEFSFESNYHYKNIKPVLDYLIDQKKATYTNDQMMIDINGRLVPLLRADGSTLYLIRDIAAALDRIKKYDCEKIIYVVDKSQSQHLNNLKEAIKNITNKDCIDHIPFGRIVGMSTRKGTSIFLDEILEEATNKMAQEQEKSPNTKTTDFETTRTLGLSALITYILKQRRTRDFQFSWDQAMQNTGDSGVKLQYTHARLTSLDEKLNLKIPGECDPSLLLEPSALDLILQLSEFEKALEDTEENIESFYLVTYLFKLCNLCSKCLKVLPVKNQPKAIAEQRMLLFNKTRERLNFSMKLLGLKPLNRM